MDVGSIISVIQESLYLILVFCAFLGFAMVRGKQSLINLILGLYIALLISFKFPYYDVLLGNIKGHSASDSVVMILLFAVFMFIATYLFEKLMPRDYDEAAFEGFGKKVLFALLASILVMAYSYHALPVTDLITPGSPIQSLFAPEANFFWWLLIPLAGLLFL